MSDESKCEICKKPASQKCGGCHVAFYCSKEHQKQAWKTHKKDCKPFKICEDEILGRHLIATKPIKSGDVILREAPLIWGPSQLTPPVCLGCGKFLTQETNVPCSKCGWPMCSEICERAPCHIPECRYTAQRGEKVCIRNFEIIHPTYQCIVVLRCLYQRQFLPGVWKKLDKLESHCKERKGSPKYENERINISEFIKRFFKLGYAFTEEDIMRVCGIIMVNGHEVPLSEPPHVAIYEFTSMLEHTCRANCSKSFKNDGSILITAGENIEKGQHLSICYTDPLWGTPNRRHHLYETKFFWCTCSRCSDPTEFGTYFSALKCQESNCKGYLLPETFIGEAENGKLNDWKCNRCSKTLIAYTVHDILERLGSDLAEMEKGNSEACLNFIKLCEPYLHPNHFYLTDVKFALAQLLGQEFKGGLPDLSESDLELKATLCRQVISIAKRIMPAEKRATGLLLFELHAAIAELGRKKTISTSDPEFLHAALLESRKHLLECEELLKNEPSLLPEGKLYLQAKQNLKNIETTLQTVRSRIGDVPI